MNNNLRAQNPLIYYEEVPLALYWDDSPPTAGEKSKFDREDKPREYSRSNNKANPKVKIHDLLRKNFTNGIWEVNLSLRFRDLASFFNVHTSALSMEDKLFTLGLSHLWSSPYCKNTNLKATYEEAKHMINILEKAINNSDQVQGVSVGEKRK